MRIDVSEGALTLTDKAVDAIVRAAAEGQLRPGCRLLETDLAKRLGISRVPVREALRLLESQGVVVNLPYKGMHLFQGDDASLSKILSVRLLLETHAAKIAIQAIRKNRARLDLFEDALAAMEIAVRRGSVFDIAMADIQFHRAIYVVTDNQLLVDMWSMMSRKMLILIGLGMYETDRQAVYESHRALLALAREGNTEAFLHALRPHISEVMDRTVLSA